MHRVVRSFWSGLALAPCAVALALSAGTALAASLSRGTALAATGSQSSLLAASGPQRGGRSSQDAPLESPAPSIVLPAHVVAYQAALITAKVAGYVKRIQVDTGDHVKAGELIAELEVPELQADRLRYAAEADVAQRNYDRMLRAIKAAPDLVTPEQQEVARGQVEVAQAKLARVDALLRYARVTAPFSGTITARYVDPGAFVPVPNGGSSQGGAIVMLMRLSEVRVQIPVPESDAPAVKPGCPAVITAAELPGLSFSAPITRISHALARKSQTMLAEIDMPNPRHLLVPGMYVSVRLLPGSAQVAAAGAGAPRQ